jgi:hypothetical protein
MEGYSAKPIHLVYPLLLFALGAWCLVRTGDAWLWIGFACWGLSLIAAIWIVIAGFWAERSRYYWNVAHALEAASKNDIDKLAALGFSHKDLPAKVHIDLYGDTWSRHFDLPVPAAKLQPLAQGLLNGQPFSERRWVNDSGLFSADEFRRLRGVFRDRELIEPVNEKDNRQGFKLTAAGVEVMQACISSPPPLVEIAENA